MIVSAFRCQVFRMGRSGTTVPAVARVPGARMRDASMRTKSNRSIVEIVREYRRTYEEDASRADRRDLESSRALLYDEIETSSWDARVVHSGHELFHRLGDKEAIVDLLNRYLGTLSLDVSEENWARWNLTDNLAMLRRCEEAVDSQKAYLDWGRRMLPAPDWQLPAEWPFDIGHDWRPYRKEVPADECLLFRIMYDGTQALCWIEASRSDEWLDIYRALIGEVPPTDRNRVERRYLIRTACAVLNNSGRPAEALEEAGELDRLSQEHEHWEEAAETAFDARAAEIEAYRMLDDMPGLRRAAQTVTSGLERQYERRADLKKDEVKALWGLYHNTAAPIYRARQYDLAIPLFSRAIELGIPSNHAYLWLAASIWATERDRTRVLSLLNQGVAYSRFGRHGTAAEFEDVMDDPEFQAALSGSQPK